MGVVSSASRALTAEQVLMLIGDYLESRHMSVEEAFTFLDADASGFVTWDEFLRGVRLCVEGTYHAVATPEALWPIFSRFDTSGDGKLNVHEFAAVFDRPRARSQRFPTFALASAEGLPRRGLADSVIARIASSIVRAGRAPMELFSCLDSDGNGTLSRLELERVIAAFQPDLTASEREACFARFDRNGSGGVDLIEFCQALQDVNASALIAVEAKVALMGQRFKERGHTALGSFVLFDRNGDGCLTRSEWQRAMAVLGPEFGPDDLETIFRRFDFNGDGLLGIAEFADFFEDAIRQHDRSVVATALATPLQQLGNYPSLLQGHSVLDVRPGSYGEIAMKERSWEMTWEREVLDLVASCLSPSRSGLGTMEVFRRLDVDSSGTITAYEFNRMVHAYRPELTQSELDSLFFRVNTSKTGAITFQEFQRRFG